MKRIKRTANAGAELSREEVEGLVHDIALAANLERRLTADMDEELGQVRARYQGNLEAIGTDLAEKTRLVQGWAESHPEEFGKRKSIDFVSATVGFRTGTPKLALVSRRFNWEGVLQILKRCSWAAGFIRTKEEVDKDGILRSDVAAERLAQAGLKVVQEEKFFIEPNLTPVESRQVGEARNTNTTNAPMAA